MNRQPGYCDSAVSAVPPDTRILNRWIVLWK